MNEIEKVIQKIENEMIKIHGEILKNNADTFKAGEFVGLRQAKEIIESEQKEPLTNFDTITESPASLVNYYLTLLRSIIEENGMELEIEPDVAEWLLDYLNQPTESRE